MLCHFELPQDLGLARSMHYLVGLGPSGLREHMDNWQGSHLRGLGPNPQPRKPGVQPRRPKEP